MIASISMKSGAVMAHGKPRNSSLVQSERHDDAERGSVDQNLVIRKPKHAGHLKQLHADVGDG
jgi:hypothetical protein